MTDFLLLGGWPDFGWLALAYFIGTIPFGMLLGLAFGLGDVRGQGSGNIGATNLLRVGGKKLGALTLFFDMLKGAAAVALAIWLGLGKGAEVLFGAFAVVGHVFPLWLRFKGGKGVATYFGAVLMIDWFVGLIGLALWLLVAAMFRFSSLAALVTVVLLPGVFYTMVGLEAALVMALVGVLIVIRHQTNIGRLIAGTETRIGGKS